MHLAHRFRSLILAAALPALTSLGFAADSEELAALRAQVQQLEQQLKVLSRNLELREEAEATAAKSAAKVTVNDKGATLASADSANSIRLRGLVQFDSRLFFGDDGGLTNNAFVLRRARLITEGQFAKRYGFQLVGELGGSSVSLLDANVTVALSPAVQFKFGKFKVPIGLELLQSDSWTFFNERSLVTNLVPNRDVGAQASGDLLDGRVSYQAGVFGGVADNASSSNTDFDNEKEAVGRVMVTPWKNDAASPVQGLSFGVAASSGRQKTTSGRTGGYRTDGQQTFFTYLPTTVADGRTWRVAPQFDFRSGSFGAIGEYVISTVNLRPTATGPKRELQNKAWQIAAGYVLTGEDSSFNGVVPRNNFDPSAGTWGAFEIVARYAQLDIDDAAFPTFASPGASADTATSLGLGLNWYLAKAVAFKLDYFHTKFDFPSSLTATPTNLVLRNDEHAIISRVQVSF